MCSFEEMYYPVQYYLVMSIYSFFCSEFIIWKVVKILHDFKEKNDSFSDQS